MTATSPTPSTTAVELADAHRSFGRVAAVAGLTLSASPGSVTVLVGPNGAGKTTALRLLTGALAPDRGTVRTLGLDPVAHGEAVRRRCGVVAARAALYERLSGLDNLRYAGRLHGLAGRELDARVVAAAERFSIAEALGKRVSGYSTGMKARLALARAVLHAPALLLLDEPTSGLDPESSRAVLALVAELARGGTAVVVCTHLLLEAEGLADQLVVLDRGRAVAAGAPAELVRACWPTTRVLLDADERDRLGLLAGLPGVDGVATDPAGPAVVTVDDPARVPDLVRALVEAGVRVTRVEPHRPTLEELYLRLRAHPGSAASADVGRGAP